MTRNSLVAYRLLLALLVVVVSLANIQWIRKDAAPMPHPKDPYVYATKTLEFLDDAKLGALGGISESLSQLSYQGRTPLYQFLSMPFVTLFGRSTDAMLGLNVILNALLIVFVFEFGRSVSSSRAGLLAAAAVATAPPLIHLSRIYRPHGAIALFAVFSVWLLARLARDPTAKNAWYFCCSLSLGLLFHVTFGYAVAAPTILFGTYAIFFQKTPRYPKSASNFFHWIDAKLTSPLVIRGIIPAATFGALATLSWYLTKGSWLFEKILELGNLKFIRPNGFFEVDPTFWWYALTSPGAITNVVALLSFFGALACLGKRRIEPVLFAVTAFSGYAIQSTAPTRSWWYFAPLLPFWSLAMGIWIAELRRRWLSALLGTLLVAACGVSFFASNWGTPGGLRPIAKALGAQIDSQTCSYKRPGVFCSSPPEIEAWPIAEILSVILEDAPDCRNGTRTCRVFPIVKAHVGLEPEEWPMMMPAYFGYHVARHFPRATFNFSKLERGPKCTINQGLRKDYIVFFRSREPVGMDCIGEWTRYLLKQRSEISKTHTVLAEIELPGDRTASVLKRIRRTAR